MEVANPYAVLSLIVAPAILTNASSVLILSTSNRLARAVDRARELAKQLEESVDYTTPTAKRRLTELAAAESRALLLLHALQSAYVALGGFAAAALLSLLGAAAVPSGLERLVLVLEILGIVAGILAVGSLVRGSYCLMTETRIAVATVNTRAATIRTRIEETSLMADEKL